MEVVLEVDPEVVLVVPQEVVNQEVVVVFPDEIPSNGWYRRRHEVLQVVLEVDQEVVQEVFLEVDPGVVLKVVLEVLPLTFRDGVLLKDLERLNYVSDAVLKAD